MWRPEITTAITWRQRLVDNFLMTQDLDFLMTQDNNYLVLQNSWTTTITWRARVTTIIT